MILFSNKNIFFLNYAVKKMYLYLMPFKYNGLKKTIETFILLHANKLKDDD